MPSVVDDKCGLCLSCVQVCPVDAFHLQEGEKMVVVNPDTCIDCSVCIDECPNGAIKNDMDADAKWIEFNKEKSAAWPEAKK